jgi:hypothetical protein
MDPSLPPSGKAPACCFEYFPLPALRPGGQKDAVESAAVGHADPVTAELRAEGEAFVEAGFFQEPG